MIELCGSDHCFVLMMVLLCIQMAQTSPKPDTLYDTEIKTNLTDIQNSTKKSNTHRHILDDIHMNMLETETVNSQKVKAANMNTPQAESVISQEVQPRSMSKHVDINRYILHKRRSRSSRQRCPELIVGQCPDLANYPQCNMMRITNVCPWRWVNNTIAECLTSKPCYGIDISYPNLRCEVYSYINPDGVSHPIACLAVRPKMLLAGSDLDQPETKVANKPIVG